MTQPHHPLHIDVAAIYELLRRDQTFKNKEQEHKAACERVRQLVYSAHAGYLQAAAQVQQET